MIVVAALLAQDTTRALTIDTLTVDAPRAVSVVTKERIQAGRPGLTLDEALSDVPGIFINNRYNFDFGPRISSRGFGARAAFGVRGIRVILDGIPLTMPDGQSNLNNVDLTSVGSIEVLRGAASVLHGNAAGGVIYIHSEVPATGWTLETRGIEATSYRRLNAKAGGTSSGASYLVSVAHARGDGFREHSRFEQTNATARLMRGGTALTFSIARSPIAQNPGGLPRDSAEQRPDMAWPRNVATDAGESGGQVQAGISQRLRTGGAQIELATWGVRRKVDNPLPFAFIALERHAFGARAAADYRQLAFGVASEGQFDQRDEYANNGGEAAARQRDQTDRVISIAPFARLTQPVGDRLTVHAGARYDRIRVEVEDRFTGDGRDDSAVRTMAALSPAVGATLTLAGGQTVFANVSTAFQTPNTAEIINRPPETGQPCCPRGFNSIDPERAVSFELGFRGRTGPLTISAALYHMNITDAIVPFQVVQVEGRDFFRNAGRTRHRGLELGLGAQLTANLGLALSYTFSDFVFVDDGLDAVANEGHQLPGVPAHHLFVRPEIRATRIVIEPEAEYTSSYFGDDANSVAARNQGVLVVNLRLRASQPFGRMGIAPFVAVNNLTDKDYNSSVVINAAGGRFFEPAPGRNFLIGVGLSLRATP